MEKNPVVTEPVVSEIGIYCLVGNFFIALFHKLFDHVRWNDAMNRIKVVLTHGV